MDTFTPTICTKCVIPHVDNCPECFGFGLRVTGSPINAHSASVYPEQKHVQCPICKGTPKGIWESNNERMY